jgi:hypothetical protein
MLAFLKKLEVLDRDADGGGMSGANPCDPVPLLRRPRRAPLCPSAANTPRHSTGLPVLKGWSPFLIASVLIFVTALPAIA